MHAQILKYFTTVAELGTIREASRRLHVSASAINRQVLNLEERIGEPVFERSRTGMKLTEAGEIVFRHCRSTLQDFARMTSEIDARRGRVTGTVQILTLDSMTVQFLPESIASFHAEHPLVEIHVRSTDPAATIRDVSRGEADIGFGFHDATTAGASVVERIRTPMHVLMHPAHPLARESMVTLQQCAGHSLIYQYHSTAVDSILGGEVQTLREQSSPVVMSNTLSLTKSLILRHAHQTSPHHRAQPASRRSPRDSPARDDHHRVGRPGPAGRQPSPRSARPANRKAIARATSVRPRPGPGGYLRFHRGPG